MRIRLIPSDPKFAALWHEWRMDAELRRFNPLESLSLEELRERLAQASSDLSFFQSHEHFVWFIEADAEVVGLINLKNINRMMLTAEIGYSIAPKSRAKGFATQAVRLVVGRCIEETPLRKLIAFVHEDNVPSRMVLERVGFKLEGLLREHFLIENEPVNEVLYGLLRTETQEKNVFEPDRN